MHVCVWVITFLVKKKKKYKKRIGDERWNKKEENKRNLKDACLFGLLYADQLGEWGSR